MGNSKESYNNITQVQYIYQIDKISIETPNHSIGWWIRCKKCMIENDFKCANFGGHYLHLATLLAFFSFVITCLKWKRTPYLLRDEFNFECRNLGILLIGKLVLQWENATVHPM